MASDSPRAVFIFSKIYLYTFVALFIYVVLSVFISLFEDTYRTLHVSIDLVASIISAKIYSQIKYNHYQQEEWLECKKKQSSAGQSNADHEVHNIMLSRHIN